MLDVNEIANNIGYLSDDQKDVNELLQEYIQKNPLEYQEMISDAKTKIQDYLNKQPLKFYKGQIIIDETIPIPNFSTFMKERKTDVNQNNLET